MIVREEFENGTKEMAKTRLIIYVLMAWSDLSMGILMWYGSTRVMTLRYFNLAQMMYPAAN